MYATLFSIIITALGLAFVYAALAKIKSFKHFQLAIAGYTFLPTSVVRPLSFGIILLECLLGLALLIGIAIGFTLAMSCFMTAGFAIVAHTAAISNESSACFCFGFDGVRANSWKNGIRTFLILGGTATALMMWYFAPQFKLPSLSLETGLLAWVLIMLLAWLSDLPDLLFNGRYDIDLT